MSSFPLAWLVILLFVLVTCKEFEPYADNGGTIAGIAGKGYCVVASDTRLSDGYIIRSRDMARVFEIGDEMMFAGSGCWSDTIALTKVLQQQQRYYVHQNKRPMRIAALSNLLATVLYSRRMFPYYSFSCVGGIDDKEIGALYRYDAVGSYERVTALCAGKGEQLITPMLDDITGMDQDEQLWKYSPDEDAFVSPKLYCVSLSVDEACDVLINAFRAAAEREITIGDGIEMWVMEKTDYNNNTDSEGLQDSCNETESVSNCHISSDTDVNKERNISTLRTESNAHTAVLSENSLSTLTDVLANESFLPKKSCAEEVPCHESAPIIDSDLSCRSDVASSSASHDINHESNSTVPTSKACMSKEDSIKSKIAKLISHLGGDNDSTPLPKRTCTITKRFIHLPKH